MARRLSVVISQHAQRGQAQTAMEEAFVGQLIFINGLDPSLIASLDRIELGSTDHLFLEGLGSDFVLLNWVDRDAVAKELIRIGFSGHLVTLGTAERIPFGTASPRRVYHVQLDSSRTVDSVIQSLRDLLKDLNTPTVAIGMAAKPKSNSVTLPVIPGPASITAKSTEPKPAVNVPPPIIPAQQATYFLDDEEEWDHLDHLVDQLDESDI
jgi:hypothetical protein